MKGSQGINGPPQTQRRTGAVPVPGSTSFSSDSTPPPLSPGPRGGAQQSRPLCKSTEAQNTPRPEKNATASTKSWGPGCGGGLWLSCCPNLHQPQVQPEVQANMLGSTGKTAENNFTFLVC